MPIRVSVASVLVLVLASGCSKPPTCSVPEGSQAAEQTLIGGNTQFALALYGPITQAANGNAVYSPYSISSALQMVSAGAAGETATQLSTVLGLPSGAPSVTGIAAANLDCTIRQDGSGSGNTFDIADSLFGQQGFSFESSFLSLLKTDYAAPLQTENFETASQAATNDINAWVSSETAGQIQNLISPGAVDDSTLLVLVNAIYFKGTWQVQFEASNTQPAAFTTSTGGESMPPTMQVVLPKAQLGGSTDFRMLEVPYAGGRLAMDILLPSATNGLPAVEAELTPTMLSQALASFETEDVALSVPKFKFQKSSELSSILEGLGITDAFEQHVANLSGIDGEDDLYVSAVLHAATIEVDEQGSVATAATAVVASVDAIARQGPPPPVPFVVDHPFAFLIRDLPTGSILFAGHVLDPTE